MMRKTMCFFLAMLMTGCGGRPSELRDTSDASPDKETPEVAQPSFVGFSKEAKMEGLEMNLRQVDPPSQPVEKRPVAKTRPLPEKQTRDLIARLPKLEVEKRDAAPFRKREGSPPPPRTGAVQKSSFPAKQVRDLPPTADKGPLTVLRYAPEGDVALAPHVSLTFSEPMVAVTTQKEASKTVPALLTPSPKGDWRWLGTRTLLFAPEDRLPMATDYRVVVPAGTKSARGAGLPKELTYTFSTPPLGLTHHAPRDDRPVGLRPVIFIEFDQRINPEELQEHIELSSDGTSYPLRRAERDEIRGDDEARRLLDGAAKDRWIALVPKKPLPKDTAFRVVLEAAAPSAEGPRLTTGDQAFSLRTFAPLRIERHRCGYNDQCPPGADWRIDFNNPLAEDSIDPEQVVISPEIEGKEVILVGRTLEIQGIKKGRTLYEVTVPAGLKDAFGQALGKDRKVTFDVGPADPAFFGPGESILTLDPNGPAELTVHSVNQERLRLRINKVSPEDWPEYLRFLRERHRSRDIPLKLPGEPVADERVAVRGGKDALTATHLDLSAHLEDGVGQLIVWVEPADQPKEHWRRVDSITWVQSTRIGLRAFSDDRELVAWTTRLADGRPLGGVSVFVLPGKEIKGRSDDVGLARLELPKAAKGPAVLVARQGEDVVLLPRTTGFWDSDAAWRRVEGAGQMTWYTFDDRGMYRPGEEVKLKGWIRQREPGPRGGVASVSPLPRAITWTLRGARGNELAGGRVKLSALGGFDLSAKLPKDANLGSAWFQLQASGGETLAGTDHHHSIQVQEFRRPEYEVSTSARHHDPVLGEEAIVDAEAAYYAGGGLPGAPITWTVRAEEGAFVPPNRDDYHFGPWRPWWMGWGGPSGVSTAKSLSGKTDALGQHHLGIHFGALDPVQPMNITAEARVTDVNRQTWSSSSSMVLHPAELYVGIKTDRGFYAGGDEINVEALVVDLDGEARGDVTIDMTLSRLAWKRKGHGWEEVEEAPDSCRIASTHRPVACSFEPKRGGTYLLRAVIEDRAGRPNVTTTRLWISGSDMPEDRGLKREEVTLVPDAKSYAPGDTAALFVQAPFAPAEGVLTLRRDGLADVRRFTMNEPTTTLEIPIEDWAVPNVHVQVDLVGSKARDKENKLPPRVAHATGQVELKIPPLSRTLEVVVDPASKQLAPGGKTRVAVQVLDASKRPVKGAEVALAVVDESVLALTGYQLPDPVSIFHAGRGPGVFDFAVRDQIVLSDPQRLTQDRARGGGGTGEGTVSMMLTRKAAMPMAAPMASDAAFEEANMQLAAAPPQQQAAPVQVREDFRALALFAPAMKTDGDGRAVTALALPDSLTRYRLMAVAVADEAFFGKGEATVTARLPLMVRPSAPRFLNFGDRAELPVVFQNQTDDILSVRAAVRGSNVAFASSIEGLDVEAFEGGASEAGVAFEVPAGDRVEVRFPVAASSAGTARFQVIGQAEGAEDAASFDLPVYTPATSEAFATYGEIDEDALVQPIQAPKDVWPQFGGLEITTSSTQLQALTDAVIYLAKYPFECSEQLASRVLAVAALRDVLGAFAAEGLPEKKELLAAVSDDLELLAGRQNSDGGWGFWRRGDRSWPYLTVHVAHALAAARKKGYEVPASSWQQALRYLQSIEDHLPSWYSKESRYAVRAYAATVRAKMDDVDAGAARRLFNEAGLGGLSLEALGWLLPVLHRGGAENEVERILRHLENRVEETAATAHFTTSYSDGEHVLFHSDRRADGVVLEALIAVRPKSDLIAKIVRGLLAHRTKGRWGNTQENSFVLLAMDRYFQAFEKTTPDFVARVWLGDRYAGDHRFKGRSTDRALIKVPMDQMGRPGQTESLTVQKDGKGRLYYRIGLKYAPKDLELSPADYGFALERRYEPVDDPGDVRRDKDGTWRVRSGARVRVRIDMVAPARRYHVALIDPLPAGFEVVNPALAVSEGVPADPQAAIGDSRYWWWFRPWYEHQNMRDERVEAFTSLLWDGVHTYTFVARATTPGAFTVPPTKAEEMYHPETFGRTGTDKVIVE